MKSLLLITFSLPVAFAACPRELVGQETVTTALKNQAADTTPPSGSSTPRALVVRQIEIRALRREVEQLRRDVEKLIRLIETRDELQARPAGWNELAKAGTQAARPAAERLVTRFYPIDDLLVPMGGTTQKPTESQAPPPLDFQTLTDLILGSVSPDTWRQAGGKGWMTPSPDNSALIVRQTRPVHQEIHNLLSQLRSLLQAKNQSRDASDSCHPCGQ